MNVAWERQFGHALRGLGLLLLNLDQVMQQRSPCFEACSVAVHGGLLKTPTEAASKRTEMRDAGKAQDRSPQPLQAPVP